MNISQHLFVPTTSYIEGYYGAGGTLIQSSSYSTTPIQSYPYANSTTGLVNKFIAYSNTTNKLRTWSGSTPSSQNSTGYSVEKASVTDLNSTVRKWVFPVITGEFMVQLLMWKESLANSLSLLNEQIVDSKSVTEDVLSLFED